MLAIDSSKHNFDRTNCAIPIESPIRCVKPHPGVVSIRIARLHKVWTAGLVKALMSISFVTKYD